jgi:ubiquinone/menaquinone biosynthesis C-methylase UbiE
MNDLHEVDLEKTAAAYEALLVPALFQEWATRMAVAADVRPGETVLDVACGTGVLTRAIAERVGTDGSVTGLDLNPGMLAIAKQKTPDVDWREGRAESLPFDDAVFDVVVSQFGLMLFESPESALREMNRVLTPEGRLRVAVFDSLDRHPAFAALADVYERMVDPSTGKALRFPFSLGDLDALTSVLRRAGIDAPVISTHKATAQYRDPRHVVLADVKGWFPFAQIHLDDDTIDRIVDEVTTVLSPYTTSSGAVQFDVSVHVVAARKA